MCSIAAWSNPVLLTGPYIVVAFRGSHFRLTPERPENSLGIILNVTCYSIMTRTKRIRVLVSVVCFLSLAVILLVNERVRAQQQRPSSFSPVIEEPFDVVRARDKAAKPRVMAEHQRLLEERYDLSRRVDESVRMTRGKPIPVGPTAKLKSGLTWDQLGRMTPEAIRDQGVFPYLPLPHVSHAVGGMVFPQQEIKLLPRVERFDMDFDLPEQFLPEFPPAMFLTTRKDLGDVSKGQLDGRRNDDHCAGSD